jgi:NADH dehydrogenase
MAARIVTVFGGSGFIGRYLVQRLARQGWIVRVAVRRPDRALFLKPMGAVGQITPIAASLRHEGSIAAAVAGAEAVVNLVGILHGRGPNSFAAIHVEGAARTARAGRTAGVRTFVQMSALGADPNSPAEYGRSKAAGERAVREAIPAAVIVRPSIVFGPEDDFFNRFATMARFLPALPLIGGGKTRFQFVFAGDVARAIADAVEGKAKPGTVYELGGREIVSFRESTELMLQIIGRKRLLVPVPWGIASALGSIFQYLPGKVLTADQVRELRSDNIVSAAAIAEGRTIKAFGVEPTTLEAILPTYLSRFRVRGEYERRAA